MKKYKKQKKQKRKEIQNNYKMCIKKANKAFFFSYSLTFSNPLLSGFIDF